MPVSSVSEEAASSAEAEGFGKIAWAVAMSNTATVGAIALPSASDALFIFNFGADKVSFFGFGSSIGSSFSWTSAREYFCIAMVSVSTGVESGSCEVTSTTLSLIVFMSVLDTEDSFSSPAPATEPTAFAIFSP